MIATRTVGAYVLLELADRDGPPADPGQFHMLATVSGWGGAEGERPFLPRALSPMGSSAGHLWFMIEVVGPGTQRLATLKKGDALWVSGPFGRGFRFSDGHPHGGGDGVIGGGAAAGAKPPPRRPILVADGIGLAPIMAWARALVERGIQPTLLLGFADIRHALIASSFGGARLASDDGSIGYHGSVGDLLAEELDANPDAVVHASGSPTTLEHVRALTAARGVPAELALKGAMACGFGACGGCAVPLAGGGEALVCVDGPVLDATTLAAVPAR